MTYPVFPSFPGQAIGITRAPLWRTGVQSALSGKEVRLAYMSYPLYQWTMDLNALRSYGGNTELAQIIGFFNALNGMAGDFLFTDPEDNTMTNQVIGTGDGVTRSFQLVRSYGGYAEPVQQPNSIAIFVNGVLNADSPGFGANGVVNFGTAPPSGYSITASGSFYFLCRMLTDTQVFTQEFINAWSTQTLSFQSVKL
ncbi:MAG: DUF2460 domain-containing protein [Rhodanobacter sp.]